jgi:hypothetical protein
MSNGSFKMLFLCVLLIKNTLGGIFLSNIAGRLLGFSGN